MVIDLPDRASVFDTRAALLAWLRNRGGALAIFVLLFVKLK